MPQQARIKGQRRLPRRLEHPAGSGELYRSLIEHALDVITVVRADGTIRYQSPALERILGYRPEELIGRNAFDYIHPDDRPRVQEAIRRQMQGAEALVECRCLHRNGTWRVLEGAGRRLSSGPDAFDIVVSSRDITERKHAEEELREKEAALQRSNEQLKSLTARLLTTEEEQRRRLAREMHDDLNQRLGALSMELGSLARNCTRHQTSEEPNAIGRQLQDLQLRVVRLSEDVRRMAHQLHPSILDDLGLAAALRSYCQALAERHALRIRFSARAVPQRLQPEIASCLYRIAQEALWNLVRHAHTPRASVVLLGTRTKLCMIIRDYGIGFDPAVKAKGGLGLLSMEERAHSVNGCLAVDSRPGKGTRIAVQVPLREAAA